MARLQVVYGSTVAGHATTRGPSEQLGGMPVAALYRRASSIESSLLTLEAELRDILAEIERREYGESSARADSPPPGTSG